MDLHYRRLGLISFVVLFGALILCIFEWYLGMCLSFNFDPIQYHQMRVKTGRVKDRLALSDKVELLRTTGGVGMHLRGGGELLLGDLVQRLDYEDATHSAVIAACGHSPYSSRVTNDVFTLPDPTSSETLWLARVDLATGVVSCPLPNPQGREERKLKDIRTFWPLRKNAGNSNGPAGVAQLFPFTAPSSYALISVPPTR